MRILVVLPGLNGGGAERVASILLSEWQTMDNTVFCISTAKNQDASYKDFGNIKTVFVPNAHHLKIFSKIHFIRSFVKTKYIDFMIPFSETSSVLCVLAAIFTKVKVICTERNSPADYPKGFLKRSLRLFSYNTASLIVFQSEFAKAFFPKMIQKKSIIIPNPVKRDLPHRNEQKRKKTIVFLGRLSEQKNVNYALLGTIDFLKEHPDYSLIIIGHDYLNGETQRIANSLQTKLQIRFIDFTQNSDSYLACASIFIMTSLYEGFPNSMLEAAAIGVPIVTLDFRPGTAKDLVKNGKNGFVLSPSSSYEAFSAKLSEIICNYSSFSKESLLFSNKIRKTHDGSSVAFLWIKAMKALH